VATQADVFRFHFGVASSAMVSSRARQRAFVDELTNVVKSTVSAMKPITVTQPVAKLFHDRRGWEIHMVVAEEELHHAKEMLEVAKANLLEASQTSKYARLLHNRSPWRDVRRGFRTLIAFMEDETNACTEIYELGECPHWTNCSKKHPRCIKRLFVVVKSTLVDSDLSSSHCEGSTSTSTDAQSAPSAQTTACLESSLAGQNWNGASHSGSTCGLLGYGSVEDNSSLISEGSPVEPLFILRAPPHVHVSQKNKSKNPSDVQAPTFHEMAFGVPVETHLRSGLVISL